MSRAPAAAAGPGPVRLALTPAGAELLLRLIGDGERELRAWSAVANDDGPYSTELPALAALRGRLTAALDFALASAARPPQLQPRIIAALRREACREEAAMMGEPPPQGCDGDCLDCSVTSMDAAVAGLLHVAPLVLASVFEHGGPPGQQTPAA